MRDNVCEMKICMVCIRLLSKKEERMVEDTGIEPVTPCMPCKYSPS